MPARWLDLVDPSRGELLASLPVQVDPDVVEILLATPSDGIRVRPLLEGHGAYVLGVFLEALPIPDEDRVAYREVDVVATPELVLTVRKSPPDGAPWDPAPLELAEEGLDAGELLHRLVDDVADSFLDVVDAMDAEIDELEENMEEWSSDRVRRRVAGLRHDLLHARRNVSAMRSAVRRIVDGRLDVGDERLFPAAVERRFADTHETLLRAGEELDVARDLLASSRDYHQSKIAENQNEIVKTLTVIASLVLVPTLIVGFYGQNFARAFGERYWSIGVSTSLIVATTFIQLAAYRWRRWI
ncbi:MAG: magnesium transporter CorA family protein [Gaiellaceae bacterium]